ncbi:hypothetical protein M569_09514, partial [Genlisea aurea]
SAPKSTGNGKSITVSQAKNKLKSTRGADAALRIYAASTSADRDSFFFSTAVGYNQGLTVRRLALSNRFPEIESFLESHKSQPQVAAEGFVAALIRSYGSVGMIENAARTYEQMPEFGTPRTPLSFNALLNACIHSKAPHRVAAYFAELPAKHGFSPNPISYGILIKSHCQAGNLGLALQTLNQMDQKGVEITAVTFTTILHELYTNNRIEEAENLWNETVSRKGFQPDVGCYNAKLSHLSRSGNPDDLKSVIGEMKGRGLEPDAISLNYLISCHCLRGNVDAAVGVYDDLVRKRGMNPNAATYRTLVFHLCERDRFLDGYRVFRRSVKARKMPGFDALKRLLEGLAKRGHRDEAGAMVRVVRRKALPEELAKAWDEVVEQVEL